jgi:ABC-type spermidine/putrescine transport system permease subunit I
MFLNNPDVWEITLLSLKVSGLATLISLFIGRWENFPGGLSC